MMTDNDDNRSKNPRVAGNRCTRARQACQSAELDNQQTAVQSESKRTSRRNALANTATVSTNANASCQKHQNHQLAERVRELQKEIAPDLFYQMMSTYSPFSPITPSSSGSSASLPSYSHQHSASISSGSSSSSVPTQRFGLSSKILERAHQIPERFWIDWQQKKTQDRIEELEYIKSNIGCGPSLPLVADEIDENGMDIYTADPRLLDDEARRQSVLYLHEAQRLANERRTSLAQNTTLDEFIPKVTEETSSLYDNDDQSLFNFDQRSEGSADAVDLSDPEETTPQPIVPVPSVQQPRSSLDRSHLTISLPFTYTNTREQIIFPRYYRQISAHPSLEQVIEVSDDAIQTTSPTNSIEDVAQIDTETNLTLLKREDPTKMNPLFYTKATVHSSVEFHKFRSMPSRTMIRVSPKKDISIPIPILSRQEINDNHSLSSPTLSFKSARSRFSSMNDIEDLNDDIQFPSVITPSSSSPSLSSRSRPTSSRLISTITQYPNSDDDYSSLEQISADKHSCSPRDLSMINVSDLDETSKSSSSSLPPSEEEDHLSLSHSVFTCRRQQQRRKQKGNSSYVSFVSPTSPSSQNNFISLHDSLSLTKDNNNNNHYNKGTLKTAHNTSIISSKRTWQWKQNDGGFRRDVLVNDNNEPVTRSSSLSTATAAETLADCLIQRQRRKQTRLKRKAGSEKRKEKKKKGKKERNKKSPLSTTRVEATEASLFQFPTVGRPIIDTSVIFYPSEQLRCADRSTTQENICFPIQTSAEYQKQESKSNSTMADGHASNTSNSIPKREENVRVFVRRRRRPTKQRQRRFLHSSSSSSSSHSHETIPPSPNNIDELVTLIQQQINNTQDKTRKNRNIIVVNYKPVFINSQPSKPSPTTKISSTTISQPKLIPTDDDFSSATHYSRRRTLTTTSSDGSPLRSTPNRAHIQQSVSLDVPDVEDPLVFIEMMYQQLFTEDGRLRCGTEPTALANCVKQIVRNSRRNSISSSHSKHFNINTNHQQQKLSPSSYHHVTPSKPISLSSSPHCNSDEHYHSTSEEDDDEEEEEEPNTLVQINNQRPSTTTINTDTSKNSKQIITDNHTQIHAFLDSCQPKQISTVNRTTATTSHGFRFSLDDTDNEDFDTFSDFNSIRFNNKTIGTSPSVEEDLTHTDSRFLSSSGYHSLDRSSKFFKQHRLALAKSHSENDLFHSLYETNTQTRCIHYCPNCLHPPHITVIPPTVPSSPSSTITTTTTNLIKRIQQPVGDMFMRYLNFILISKNVLLLPLFIFLLRQRSIRIGN